MIKYHDCRYNRIEYRIEKSSFIKYKNGGSSKDDL